MPAATYPISQPIASLFGVRRRELPLAVAQVVAVTAVVFGAALLSLVTTRMSGAPPAMWSADAFMAMCLLRSCSRRCAKLETQGRRFAVGSAAGHRRRVRAAGWICPSSCPRASQCGGQGLRHRDEQLPDHAAWAGLTARARLYWARSPAYSAMGRSHSDTIRLSHIRCVPLTWGEHGNGTAAR